MNKKITAKLLKAIHKILIQKTNKILFIVFCIFTKQQNKHYQKHKERLQKEARERYQNFTKEKKIKKA